MAFVTRFAPSPTGPLHLGHAYSALLAHDMARAAGGRFLLRIEDIDRSRARPDWEAQIYDDLRWLGIHWEEPVLRQSEQLPRYGAALDQLWAHGMLFACTCSRRDIEQALSAPQEGVTPVFGPDGMVYPGTCRSKPRPASRPRDAVLRLDLQAALSCTPMPLTFRETGEGPPRNVVTNAATYRHEIGDAVLARTEMGTSYHLSVVLDDAVQGVTHVLRGADLFEATRLHRLLQALLDLPTPVYHHHRLIRDANGKRLAKRDDARAITKYRAEGATVQDIREITGLAPAA
ncbi:glutamyl-Q tRNA(Asp) synthetase [Gemmobacter aquatilis]|uniref:Glutamyl-Q tRNA(Asp) synthetase n=1 Tax=Gemmobacter aquatilis TaxID=933059 RepID=A0A1H8BAX5_9RHOB|nr:tRNA glutamyl-Q(34) synthetase GluQRS [Gemmobacter aquatilis]SEM79972.1 glutamyl-Q tRNA(Asp) synthetase [Gemmobacter aquatilis]